MGSSTVTVLLERPGPARSFSYEWPESLGVPRLGDEVIVDLRGRRVAGWVVGLEDHYEGTIKPVLRRRRPAPPAAVVATTLAAGRWHLASPVPFLRRARSPRIADAVPGAEQPEVRLPEVPATPELAWQPFGAPPTTGVARLVEDRGWSRALVVCPSERQAARVRAELASRGHLVREAERDWRLIAKGGPGLVVGTPSVVLAPLWGPEAVLVVDAVDPLHREKAFPHADTTTLAGLRAAAEGVPLVLVGAVPPLEALRPGQQPARGPWPAVSLVGRHDHAPGDSALAEALRALPEGVSVAIVLARSRVAEGLRCRDCRARPACPRCHRPLRVARWPGPQPASLLARVQAGMSILAMACGTCGAHYPVACDRCGSTRLAPLGVSPTRAAALAEGILRCPVAVVDDKAPRASAPCLVGGVGLLDRLTQVDVVVLDGLDDLFGVRDLLGAPRMLYYLHRAALVGERVLAVLGSEEPALAEALAARDLRRFYDAELATRTRLGLPPSIQMAVIEGSLGPAARERLARDCELVALGPERVLVSNPSEVALHRALEEALGDLEQAVRVELAPRSLRVL